MLRVFEDASRVPPPEALLAGGKPPTGAQLVSLTKLASRTRLLVQPRAAAGARREDLLTGRVRLHPAAAVALGAGQIVANNGGGLVGNNGAGLVASDGGGLVGWASGSLAGGGDPGGSLVGHGERAASLGGHGERAGGRRLAAAAPSGAMPPPAAPGPA